MNTSGQVGVGDLLPHRRPTRVGGAADWTTVSVGEYTACGLRSGKLWCWGSDSSGGVGVGGKSFTPYVVPQAIRPDLSWIHISVERYHTCGVTSTNDLYCWGNQPQGQFGNGTTVGSDVPLMIGTEKWLSVNSGQYFVCGVKVAGSAWCWGSGLYGVLGNGADASSTVPVEVSGAMTWRELQVGVWSVCGIASDKTAWCWGANRYATIGDGSTTDRWVPTKAVLGGSVLSISVGESHACAQRTLGRTYCWGQDYFGQVGNGPTLTAPVLRPVRVK